tara:strand:+ start:640 stop:912 length:273 start_codon:yes stop_codon:yes gene_type:complete
MKKIIVLFIFLGGCQAGELATIVQNENGNTSQSTQALASDGGLNTYGSSSSSSSPSTVGGDNSGQIESAGAFAGEGAGGLSEGGMSAEEP